MSFLLSSKLQYGVVLACASFSPTLGHRQWRDSVPNQFIVTLNEEIFRGLGHANAAAGNAVPGGGNAFGNDIIAELGAGGQPEAVWQFACDIDSDGDGLTNGEELCDPNCLWEFGDDDPACEDGAILTHPGFNNDGEDINVPGNGALLAHAAFMIMAWAMLAPLGIVTATALKKKPNTRNGPPGWFLVHRGAMSLATTFTIIGFICILIQIGGLSLTSTHPRMGFTVVLFSIAQALSGFFRAHVPAPGEKKSSIRIVWEYGHQWSGRAIVTVATGALVTGLAVGPFDPAAAEAGGYVLAVVFGMVGIGSFLYVFLVRDKAVSNVEAKQKQPLVPMEDVHQDITMELEKQEAESLVDQKIQFNDARNKPVERSSAVTKLSSGLSKEEFGLSTSVKETPVPQVAPESVSESESEEEAEAVEKEVEETPRKKDFNDFQV